MKKSILFGALALFAIGAMSIQNVEAQNPVKKSKANTEMKKVSTKEKPASTTTSKPKAMENCKKSEKVNASDDCCKPLNKDLTSKQKPSGNTGNAGNQINSMTKPKPSSKVKTAAKPSSNAER